MYYVYAKCHNGRLQEMFVGNRSQCRKFVKDRARNGQPTHFLIISKLGYDAATRRYCD